MNIATHKHLKLLGLILFVPLVLALLSLLVGSLVTGCAAGRSGFSQPFSPD